MTFVDRLEAKSAASLPGPDCGVNRFLETLNEADRAEVVEAIGRTRTILTSKLSEAILDEYKVHVSVQTLQRHRKRQCRCARTS